eukprot:scaffold1807_cov140-Cylindrotheca_fusiformis.AAC.3
MKKLMWYKKSVENEKTDVTAEEFWTKTTPFIFSVTAVDYEKNPQVTPPIGIDEFSHFFTWDPLRFDPLSGIMTTMYERATFCVFMSQVNIARALRKPAHDC